MTQLLRQGTADTVLLGPFLSPTDANTPATTETPAVKVSKEGATPAPKNEGTVPTHGADGYYPTAIDAVDTDTVGKLVITAPGTAGALPVRHEYQVLSQAAFDSLLSSGSTGVLQPSTAGRRLDISLSGTAGVDWANVTSQGAAVDLAGTSVGVVANANIGSVDGDATAAANLAAQYDGSTGLVGGVFPATQSQVGAISSGGGSLNVPASSAVVTTGAETGDYTNSQAADGIYHQITAAPTILAEYGFIIGSGAPSLFTVTGYVQGNGSTLTIQAWDWIASAWQTIITWSGSNQVDIQTNEGALYASMVGTGANLGEVRINYVSADSSNIFIDHAYVSFSQGAGSYEDGAIWVDTNADNTGTTINVDGVSTNPVSTMAAARNLAAQLNLHRFNIAPNSAIVLDADHTDDEFAGTLWDLDLNGQDIAGCYFRGARVAGAATGTLSPRGQVFNQCLFTDAAPITLPAESGAYDCGVSSTIVAGEAGTYLFDKCHSASTTAPWVFDFGDTIGDTHLNLRAHSGNVRLESMGDAGADTANIEGWGYVEEGTCAGGTIIVAGNYALGTFTNITVLDAARFAVDQLSGGGPVDVGSIAGDAAAAVALSKSIRTVLYGAVTGAPTATSMQTDLTGLAVNALAGRVLAFDRDSTIPGQGAEITGNDAAGGITFKAIPNTAAIADEFAIA